jgi:hypothetical protein
MIGAGTVDGRRETHHGHSHFALDERGGEQLGCDTAGWVSLWIRQDVFRGHLARRTAPGSGRDDERPIGALQRLGHGLNGAPVAAAASGLLTLKSWL